MFGPIHPLDDVPVNWDEVDRVLETGLTTSESVRGDNATTPASKEQPDDAERAAQSKKRKKKSKGDEVDNE